MNSFMEATINTSRFSETPPAGLSALMITVELSGVPTSSNAHWLNISFISLDPVTGADIFTTQPVRYSFGTFPTRRLQITAAQTKARTHFTQTKSLHREISWNIFVNSSAINPSISHLYLGQPMGMENDSFWLSCDLNGPSSGATITTTINGKSMYSSSIDITWNGATEVLIACVMTWSYKSNKLNFQSPSYFPKSTIYVTILDSLTGPKYFSTAIAIQDMFRNSSTPPGAATPTPAFTFDALYYGWDQTQAASYVLTVQSNGLIYPQPPNLKFSFAVPYDFQIERYSAIYQAWGLSDPFSTDPLVLFSPLSPEPIAETSLSSTYSGEVSVADQGIYVSVSEVYHIMLYYSDIPGQGGSDVRFGISTPPSSSTSTVPFVQTSIDQSSTSFVANPPWIPDPCMAR